MTVALAVAAAVLSLSIAIAMVIVLHVPPALRRAPGQSALAAFFLSRVGRG